MQRNHRSADGIPARRWGGDLVGDRDRTVPDDAAHGTPAAESDAPAQQACTMSTGAAAADGQQRERCMTSYDIEGHYLLDADELAQVAGAAIHPDNRQGTHP